MEETKINIVKTFSEWVAFSGTKSGSPLKARKDVYPLIQLPKYEEILLGKKHISKDEFNQWHKKNTESICAEASKMPVGWSTKLINLYLKSMVYLAGIGRPNLVNLIHPPIDGGLWKGIKAAYKHEANIIAQTHHKKIIKGITTYEDYEIIIGGIEKITTRENIKLIEIEKYWQGTKW